MKRPKEIHPELLAELFEALDSLEAAARELARQKRQLFPAIRARQKAVERIRSIWKEARGRKAGPPEAPILDAIAEHRRSGAAAERARRKEARKPALRRVRASGAQAIAELDAARAAGRKEHEP